MMPEPEDNNDDAIERNESRPATPPPDKSIHERKKSKIFVLFNQLLHPEVVDPVIKSSSTSTKIKHYQSKSLSNINEIKSKNDNFPFEIKVKTPPNTSKPSIKMTRKILEFLHLKDRENGEEVDLDVEISDDELEMLKETVPLIHDRHDLSFKLKYHFIGSKIIGRGASGIVRLAGGNLDQSESKRFAVKELRRRKKQETCQEYLKKLIREFRIAMLMHHENVVNTLDFVMIGDKWYEVMEYCSGGDLFAAIQRGKMSQEEIDCCFKQLLMGVKYLHEMGVSHRDLKPENLLIDSMGHVKITDFGVSEVFCDFEWYFGNVPSLNEKCKEKTKLSDDVDKDKSEDIDVKSIQDDGKSIQDDVKSIQNDGKSSKDSICSTDKHKIHKLKGLCGSCPYIAPEEFTGQEYDGRLVDVWSLGIIYYTLIFHCVPWEMAHLKNQNYKKFLEEGFDQFEPFNRLPARPRSLLKRILEPDPIKRITIDEIISDEWFKNIRTCTERQEIPLKNNSLSYNCDFDQDDQANHQHT